MLSFCPFDISVGTCGRAFVLGLSQMSSFFSIYLFPCRFMTASVLD